MKSIIETSGYMLIFAIICFISVDLILMNIQITHVNEQARYVESYIEAYGISKSENGEIKYYKYDSSKNLIPSSKADSNAFPVLDQKYVDDIKQVVEKNGMKIDFKYMDYTNEKVYMEYTITYNLSTSSMTHYDKKHTYVGIAHFNNVAF